MSLRLCAPALIFGLVAQCAVAKTVRVSEFGFDAEDSTRFLQAALDAASAELFNPTPTTDFAEVNRKVRTLQFEIDRYTADWEEAATELEELTK